MTSRNGVIPDHLELADDLVIHRFSRAASNYLLIRGSHSLLVNCHSRQRRMDSFG